MTIFGPEGGVMEYILIGSSGYGLYKLATPVFISLMTTVMDTVWFFIFVGAYVVAVDNIACYIDRNWI